MKQVKQRIQHLLTTHPHLRDDDNKLQANIWHQDIKETGNNPDKMTATDLLGMMANGQLTNPESIRRVRQQLQEQIISLRGNRYNQRQGKIQQEIKTELGYL